MATISLLFLAWLTWGMVRWFAVWNEAFYALDGTGESDLKTHRHDVIFGATAACIYALCMGSIIVRVVLP